MSAIFYFYASIAIIKFLSKIAQTFNLLLRRPQEFYMLKKFILIVLLGFNNLTAQIEEGFVTFATENYFPLLEVLLDSVKAFSTRPIVVFGVNADVPFSQEKYPFLIKKRIDVDLSKESIYFQKPKIILESNIKYGVYVEADDILNFGVDILFEWARKSKDYPLCPKHPQDPNNQHNIMNFLCVQNKSMPYVHGHVLFSQTCMPFVKEWYETCLKYGNQASNYDETILNVLLWKYKVDKYVPVYDPYFDSLENYKNNTCPEQHGYNKNEPIHYFMFHGCKNPDEARKILDLLK